jgi:hypothetical protein
MISNIAAFLQGGLVGYLATLAYGTLSLGWWLCLALFVVLMIVGDVA